MNTLTQHERAILAERDQADAKALREMTPAVMCAPTIRSRVDGILARWCKGHVTYVQSVRELAALGMTPDEATDVLAAAKGGVRSA